MSRLHEGLRELKRRVDGRLGREVSEADARAVFAEFRKALEREHLRRRARPRLRVVSR